MRLMIMATMAALAAGSSGVLAQSSRDGERITVEGCLQQAVRNGSLGGSVVGTSADPNTAPIEANLQTPVDAYLLTEAELVSAPGAAPRTDTPLGTAGRHDFTSFGLTGRVTELEKHRGARVQVVGTVVPPATSGRGPGGAATAAGTRRLTVESFTILEARCVSRK